MRQPLKQHCLDGIQVGIADLAIGELAALVPQFFSLQWAVVTLLDSTPASKGIGQSVLEEFPSICLLENSLLVSKDDILTLTRNDRLFTHFDELYLCKTKPQPTFIGKYFTTDRADFGKYLPDEFVTIFHSLGAVRYASDGCGLNFACESSDVVEAIARAESKIDRGYPYIGTQENPPDA